MGRTRRIEPLTLVQTALLLLLLVLLLVFGSGATFKLGLLTLSLLIIYHAVIDFRLRGQQNVPPVIISYYVSIYLILCTLVVFTIRGDEESPMWLVFFLPIVIAASNLNLRATLVTCSTAILLFIVHLPSDMYLDPMKRREELPELVGFGVMYFLVGILVHSFAAENRQQLVMQRQLNEMLLENQRSLKDSLERLKEAEENLRTKERLASLGEMSAGIAHEIRNPLGIISSSAQLLDQNIKDNDARQLLDIIQEESTRLNSLITEFLTFGRQLEPQRQPCDLSLLVHRTLDTLQQVAEQQGVAILLDRHCEDCSASVDADMVQQVLLNLLLNALDATSSGGQIKITLARDETWCKIIVADTGCGIAPDSLNKVFDPFFTTKSGGTGLGLANAFKIVESHHGTLKVTSTEGEGSTFSMMLPVE